MTPKQQETILNPTISDEVATGTKGILHSPHVSEGPGRIANSPVPSVFNDDRGSIDRLRVGGKRMNILHSKKSVMRSGYLHPDAKFDYIISGSVEVWTLTPKGTDKRVYKEHETFQIEKFTPHVLHFLEDSVIVEWWEKPREPRCWYYHPYRNVVDVHNSMLSKSTGRHSRLVPQNDFDSSQQQNEFSGLGGLVWMTAGIAIGVIVGTNFLKSK